MKEYWIIFIFTNSAVSTFIYHQNSYQETINNHFANPAAKQSNTWSCFTLCLWYTKIWDTWPDIVRVIPHAHLSGWFYLPLIRSPSGHNHSRHYHLYKQWENLRNKINKPHLIFFELWRSLYWHVIWYDSVFWHLIVFEFVC